MASGDDAVMMGTAHPTALLGDASGGQGVYLYAEDVGGYVALPEVRRRALPTEGREGVHVGPERS